MHKLTISTLLPCLISVCLFLQGANAQNCATPIIRTCVKNFATAAVSQGLDKTKLCNVGKSYLICVNQLLTKSNLDPRSSSFINKTINTFKTEIANAGCAGIAEGNADPSIQTCNKIIGAAGRDKLEIIVGIAYLGCVNQIITNCNLNLDSNSVIHQAINTTKQNITKAGCDANAQSYTTTVIQVCVTNFATASAWAGQDKAKRCSAAKSYSDCVNQIVTGCNIDPSNNLAINQAINTAKQTKVVCVTNACKEIEKNLCVNSAKALILIKFNKDKACSGLDTCLTSACLGNTPKIAAIKEEVGCGASGTFYSILTIVVGFCLHRLF